MAKQKELKRASGRMIGGWKKEAIAANAGASDEDLAKIINAMALKQGYYYKITPAKVRGNKPATTAASTAASVAPRATKELKRASGRLIGMWKQDTIAANPGASDEELAKIINNIAAEQGYNYTIAPEKVRTLTRKPAPNGTVVAAPVTTRPAPARSQIGGALMENLSAFVQLVGKDGAKDMLETIIDRL